jgi:hypothetical protein
MRYYGHIEECFNVLRSLSALPESVLPIILSFLVKSDPPEWILSHKTDVDIRLFCHPYDENQWIRGLKI